MPEDKNNNEGSNNLEQDKLELQEYKKDLLNLVHISADVSGDFSESKFFVNFLIGMVDYFLLYPNIFLIFHF